MKIVRVHNSHPDFILLTRKLDAELHQRYGSGQSAYDRHNVIATIDTAVVGYLDDQPVACGCFKAVDRQTVEIKRMVVDRAHRRNGFALTVLQALEAWSAELGYRRAILETGKGQPEAIALYRKNGYRVIDNYGPYVGLENSICMHKAIA